jgi:hypothetical protein
MIRNNGASSDSRVSIDEFEFKQTSSEGGFIPIAGIQESGLNPLQEERRSYSNRTNAGEGVQSNAEMAERWP